MITSQHIYYCIIWTEKKKTPHVVITTKSFQHQTALQNQRKNTHFGPMIFSYQQTKTKKNETKIEKLRYRL